jgi:hypothetical protein
MSASPLDPMMHMLTSLALTIGAAALVTLSSVMFLLHYPSISRRIG